MTDEQLFASEVKRLEESNPPVLLTAELSPTHAAIIVAQLQLACRHPGNLGAGRTIAECFARKLQEALAQRSPDLGRLLERGWFSVFDVSTKLVR